MLNVLVIGLLLFPIILSSQTIRFDSFQGVVVPSPSIPDVCPTTSYNFSAVLTNNTGAQLGSTSATVRITVSGANSATYIIDAPGVNVADTVSFTINQAINMVNPGPNSFAVEVYLDDAPGTIIDSDFASIKVSPNPVSSNLNTSGFPQVSRQQILEIELGAIGAQTGASTATFTVTLGGVDFTTTVASGTVSSVAEVATAIAADINGNAAYSASNIGVPASPTDVNVIQITGAVSGAAFNYSTSESSTMSFGSPRIVAGSKYIEVCSNQPVTFESAGGIGSNGYNFYVNNASVTGQQNSSSYTRGSPANGDVIYAQVTNGSGCVEQTYPISLNVTLTPEDAGSPITILGTGFEPYNLNQSYQVTLSGSVDSGDTYSITTTGTTYTSSNTRTTAVSATADLEAAMLSSGLTVVNNGTSLTITSPLAGTPFSLSTFSADSNGFIGSTMLTASKGIAVCEGSTQAITISGATSYTFKDKSSTVTLTGSITTISHISNYDDGEILEFTGYTGAGATGCYSTLYVTVDVNGISDAGTISSNQTICYDGTPANLTGTAPTPTASAGITYRWEKSTDGDVYISAGATTQNYQPPSNMVSSTHYRRVAIATHNLSGEVCEEVGNVIFIKVEPKEDITVRPGSVTTPIVCAGSTIDEIFFDLSGGSVSATTISPTAISLPTGLQTLQTTAFQVNTVDVTSGGPGTYKLFINDRLYLYNSSTTDKTVIRAGLITAINSDTLAAFTATTSGTTGLNITAKESGLAFSAIILGGSGSSSMTTINTTANINEFKIYGTVDLAATPGVYSYTVSTTGATACVTHDSKSGSITVKSASTVSLTSAAGTDSKAVCVNAAITHITYDIGGGATGASVASPTSLVVDGLPAGVTSNFSAGVLTIQGTPTAPPLTETTYTYTINTSGNSGSCSETTVSGTITVAPVQTITPVSIASIRLQEVCNPSLAITPIIYDLSGSAYQ
ncbi:MAG: hypothetical protein P8L83_03240, partial [Flavobacteriaceae bacterium]|nr:hypothetical protein [Flavobacteriaceae bacterium]